MKQRNNGRATHRRLGRFVRDGKSKTRTDKMRETVRRKINVKNREMEEKIYTFFPFNQDLVIITLVR